MVSSAFPNTCIYLSILKTLINCVRHYQIIDVAHLCCDLAMIKLRIFLLYFLVFFYVYSSNTPLQTKQIGYSRTLTFCIIGCFGTDFFP